MIARNHSQTIIEYQCRASGLFMRARTVLCVLGLLSASLACGDVFEVNPTIDGVRRRTGFPFPTFTFTTNSPTIQAYFSQSASSGLRVFVTEDFLGMEFLLPTLPTGFVVTQAELSWTERGDFLLPGNQHPLLGFVGNGMLELADFNGSQLLPTVSNGVVDGRVSFDVTGFIVNRYLAENAYAGFSVHNAGFYQTTSGTFPFQSTQTDVGTYSIASRLDADVAVRPLLTIRAVPEISSGMISSIGLMAGGILLFVRPRYRSAASR